MSRSSVTSRRSGTVSLEIAAIARPAPPGNTCTSASTTLVAGLQRNVARFSNALAWFAGQRRGGDDRHRLGLSQLPLAASLRRPWTGPLRTKRYTRRTTDEVERFIQISLPE